MICLRWFTSSSSSADFVDAGVVGANVLGVFVTCCAFRVLSVIFQYEGYGYMI